MPERCVVDTSALQYLFRIGQLDLLQKLFDEVLVAEAVEQELNRGKSAGYLVPNIMDYPWITIEKPDSRSIPTELQFLGNGECASILLARETSVDQIILDDLDARYTAENLGLHVIGTIGILMRAKEQNLILTIAPLLEQLIDAGMWISIEIKQYALELSGEEIEE